MDYGLPDKCVRLYGIKTSKDVDDIIAGKPTRCQVTPLELREIFQMSNIPVPIGLKKILSYDTYG